jgi:hypothetical protein
VGSVSLALTARPERTELFHQLNVTGQKFFGRLLYLLLKSPRGVALNSLVGLAKTGKPCWRDGDKCRSSRVKVEGAALPE